MKYKENARRRWLAQSAGARRSKQHSQKYISEIKTDWIKSGAVVIDAGYHPGGFGDIEARKLSDIASAFTPVPGGVGPMTINTLIQQTVISAEKSLTTNEET